MSRAPIGRARPVHFPPFELKNRSTIVFVTVCTKFRRRLLATEAIHDYVRVIWSGATDWRVGRYLLMPDHIHFFCAPGTLPASPLKEWVEYWKSISAARWPDRRVGRVWQRGFWDTQIRTAKHYEEKWEYVRQNPVRAKLVEHPDDWPYQGELNLLRWRG